MQQWSPLLIANQINNDWLNHCWSRYKGLHCVAILVYTAFISYHFDGLVQVRPLLTHWSYVFLALTHRLNNIEASRDKLIQKQQVTQKCIKSTLEVSHMTLSNENFSRYWPFVRGIHRSPMNSPHTGPWFLWSTSWINGSANNRETGDLRRHRAHYDVIVMTLINRNFTATMSQNETISKLQALHYWAFVW